MEQKNTSGNHGLIIRHLRLRAKLTVRKCAQRIEKSVGWISEIENAMGKARLSEQEFNRIVELLDGKKHRKMFRTWVAGDKRRETINTTFDGAVLKFIRTKKQFRLKDAAHVSGLSVSTLSKIESGISVVSVDLRNKIMIAYGYQPSSFKNLSTDPARSKVVPLRFKLEILMKQMSETDLEAIFTYVQSLKTNKQPTQI